MPIFEVYDARSPRRVLVEDVRITIGRVSDNAVIIDDRQASRIHCEIRLVNDGYVLRDLKSRNGTSHNQTILREAVDLIDGDEIGIGKASIRFWTAMDRLSEESRKLPLIRVAEKKTDSEKKDATPPGGKTAMPAASRQSSSTVTRSPVAPLAAEKTPAPSTPSAALPATGRSTAQRETGAPPPASRPARSSIPAGPTRVRQSYCCDSMTEMVHFTNGTDPQAQLVEPIVQFCDRGQQFTLAVFGGQERTVPVYFCPWCGTRLTDLE